MFGAKIFSNNLFGASKGFSMVITGPMGSGKTTELFRQMERVEIAKGKALLFKPRKDDRDRGVKTHSGYRREAIELKDAEDILNYLNSDVVMIGIEEAQFFDYNICGVARVLTSRGLKVIITGLDLDAWGRPFGPMPLLLAQAEYVIKLNAVCMDCGAEASRTKRKIESKELLIPGGMDIYEPVCLACHERWLSGSIIDEL